VSGARPILLADDDAQDVELLLIAFRHAGVRARVHVVSDGAAALDYLYRRTAFADREAGIPAALVVDLKMPKVDGLEVLRAVRADPALASLPVIVMSASAEQSDRLATHRAGADAYVVKPMSLPEYISKVKLLARFWGPAAELPSEGSPERDRKAP